MKEDTEEANRMRFKMPTAREFMLSKLRYSLIHEEVVIEFAKLHVKAALEAANENVEVECDSSDVFQCVKSQSILNAYPETLIK